MLGKLLGTLKNQPTNQPNLSEREPILPNQQASASTAHSMEGGTPSVRVQNLVGKTKEAAEQPGTSRDTAHSYEAITQYKEAIYNKGKKIALIVGENVKRIGEEGYDKNKLEEVLHLVEGVNRKEINIKKLKMLAKGMLEDERTSTKVKVKLNCLLNEFNEIEGEYRKALHAHELFKKENIIAKQCEAKWQQKERDLYQNFDAISSIVQSKETTKMQKKLEEKGKLSEQERKAFRGFVQNIFDDPKTSIEDKIKLSPLLKASEIAEKEYKEAKREYKSTLIAGGFAAEVS